MNKEYIQVGDSFVVSTDQGLKKAKRLDNMTEILETENNIEEIENLKEKNNNAELYDIEIVCKISDRKFLKAISIAAFIITSIVGLSTIILSNINLAILFSLVSISSFILAANIASTLNLPKNIKRVENMEEQAHILLDKELENQKEKMIELKKESKVLPSNDLGILDETKKIEKSKLIENLKRKLEIIKDYQFIKKDIIKFSNDPLLLSLILEDMGYSESDISFISELINQDTEENEKAKSLKLAKK